MKYKAPSRCPVCKSKLSVTKLYCHKCSTTIEGDFQPCGFCSLSEDELNFIKVFIKCRGSIKDVEKELGISYPTVRSKLDTLIKNLGLENPSQVDMGDEDKKTKRNEILDQLSKGEISPKDAAEKIKNL